MPEAFYKKYIRKAVSEAVQSQTRLRDDIVYRELTKWLRDNNIRLENEMFRAVLSVSRDAAKEYIDGHTPSLSAIAESKEMQFHTFTNKDGVHTDRKALLEYVEPFYSILTARLDKENRLGDIEIRYRKVDVVDVGELFDQLLELIHDEDKDKAIHVMDQFMSDALTNINYMSALQ